MILCITSNKNIKEFKLDKKLFDKIAFPCLYFKHKDNELITTIDKHDFKDGFALMNVIQRCKKQIGMK